MKVLIACEESQAVCKEFRARGHEAFSCDIQECSGGLPEWHIKADCLEVIYGFEWDMLIGHPPCTYLSGAGLHWCDVEKHGSKAIERIIKREAAKKFFLKMWNAPIKKICLENPVGYMGRFLPYSQTIDPYFFGDPHRKRTCLWLKNLPKLFHSKVDTLFDTHTHTHTHTGTNKHRFNRQKKVFYRFKKQKFKR
jgi:hypothetical protein